MTKAAVLPENPGQRAEPFQVLRLAPSARTRSGPRLVPEHQLSLFTTQDVEAKEGIDAYRQAPWAYAAISQIATDISSLPFLLRRGPKAEDPEIEDPENPLRLLLEEPNDTMAYSDLVEAIVIYLYTTGRSYNWLAGEGATRLSRSAPPAEIWPVKSDQVHTETRPPAGITAYIYRDDVGGEYRFEPADIMPLRFFDPRQPIGGGFSPLRAAILSLYLEHHALHWNGQFFKNGATPGLIIADPNTVTPEEFARKKIEIDSTWTGRDNAFQLLYLANFQGKVESFKADHKEMAFLEMLAECRRTQLAAIGTPPAIAGEFEGMNLAQVEMQERTYWTKTLLPLKRRVETAINRYLARRIAPGAHYHIDVSGVKALQEDLNQKATRESVLVAAGLRSRKELREADGLETYPGAEEFLLASTLQPAKTKAERDQEAKEMAAMQGAGGGGADGPPAPRDRSADGVIRRVSDPKREIQRATRWRSFDVKLQRAERELESVWTPVLDELGREVVRRVRLTMPSLEAVGSRARADTAPLLIPLPGDPSDYLPDPDTLIREVVGKHGRVYRRIVARFGVDAVEEVSAGLVFDAGAPSVLTLVERDDQRVRQEVLRLLSDMRDTLEGGINQGETVKDLTDRLRGVVSPVRAERIARTEALAAANSGTYDGYKQAGVESSEWLSARDGFVREAHAEADGQVRRIGEAFEVGGERMDFPGDPTASAGNTINCRCALSPVVGSGV